LGFYLCDGLTIPLQSAVTGEAEKAQPEVIEEGKRGTSVTEAEEADEKETKKAALVDAELKLQVAEAKLKSDPLTDEIALEARAEATESPTKAPQWPCYLVASASCCCCCW